MKSYLVGIRRTVDQQVVERNETVDYAQLLMILTAELADPMGRLVSLVVIVDGD